MTSRPNNVGPLSRDWDDRWKKLRQSYQGETQVPLKKSASIWESKSVVKSLPPVRSCHHVMTPFEIIPGRTIYLSAWLDRPKEPKTPDAGVYLDANWLRHRVAGLHFDHTMYVGWPDMGVFPMPMLHQAIQRTNFWAKQDMKVEIGCMGGHGRTGTFAASLGVYLGLDAKTAITRVRKEYCERAIETSAQEDLIAGYEKWLRK